MELAKYYEDQREKRTDSINEISFILEHLKMQGVEIDPSYSEFDNSRPVGDRYVRIPYYTANCEQLCCIILDIRERLDDMQKMLKFLLQLEEATRELEELGDMQEVMKFLPTMEERNN